MRAQALSWAWSVCACEDTDLCICVYVCRVYRRACVCMCACVCFFVRGRIGSCVYVCARVCAWSAHERVHAFVREIECVCFVRWEALIAMLACSAGRSDATPHRLWKRPLGGG